MKTRLLTLPLVAPLVALLPWLVDCGGQACTEVDCNSILSIDYGAVIDEPYALTLDLGAETVDVVCLADGPNPEPLPDWLECDAAGFTITGAKADTTTAIGVTAITLADEQAIVPNVLVQTTVMEILEPNGPNCDPKCVVRNGAVSR